MPDITVDSTCEEGYAVTSVVDEWELTIDAAEEAGPSANKALVASYASCYVPAFRVGAQQRGVDDVGRIEVEATADLDEDDDLTNIEFDIKTEASLEGEADEIVARGEDICHVHSALREGLHADISVTDEAL